jgi:glucose dehydrogenase
MRLAGGLKLAAALAVSASGAGMAQQAIPDGDWRTINRDLAATRFSPLADINRSNVTQLKPAWTYALKGNNTATPLVIDSTMYLPIGNRVVALDADTGQEKWVFSGSSRSPTAPTTGRATPRAAASATGPATPRPRRACW